MQNEKFFGSSHEIAHFEGQAYNASFNDSHQDDDMTKKVVNL